MPKQKFEKLLELCLFLRSNQKAELLKAYGVVEGETKENIYLFVEKMAAYFVKKASQPDKKVFFEKSIDDFKKSLKTTRLSCEKNETQEQLLDVEKALDEI